MMNSSVHLWGLCCFFLALGAYAHAKPIYLDPAQSVEARVEDLLKRMTIEEKLSLTAGKNHMETPRIERLGIPDLRMTDGPNGVRDGVNTAFPTGICLAATWDPALAGQEARAIALESLGRGRNMQLGPCININRHPLGGRNFESFGEDPWLISRLVVEFIKGMQAEGVIACVKHYAANNSEAQRFVIDEKIDERTLREIYLPGFEASVKEAAVGSVMAAYNKVNGTYCSAHPWLLTDVLSNEWGFRGLVVSDWDATHEGVGAVRAGLDIEMPGPGKFMGEKLLADVRSGALSEKVVDERVRRILRVMFRFGLFERKFAEDKSQVNTRKAQQVAQQVAEQGAVLLKNEGDLLPLTKKVRRIAVIGPAAASLRVGGGGSSVVKPPFAVSPLQGLRERLGRKTEILYALGPDVDAALTPVPASVLKGLRAEYYDNRNLEGKPVLVRDERQVNHEWGWGSPGQGVPADTFSVRWTGELVPSESGEFLLGFAGDDGYRLYLDDRLVVEYWSEHGREVRSAPVTLEAGRHYDLRVEYFESKGEADAILLWSPKVGGMDEAVAAARSADVAVVFVGLSEKLESEGYDRGSFELPKSHEELIRAVAGANPRTVVVIQAGSPVGMEAWLDRVPAVLQAWYPGMMGGHAIARLLMGDVAPSGKLPVTFPRRLEDCAADRSFPRKETSVSYEEGIYVGYRHYDTRGVEPLFPFGHGLSYTTFEYTGLKTTRTDGITRVSFSMRNTGRVAGSEVIQVYVRPMAAQDRPFQELKAFRKIRLEPGRRQTVTLDLDPRSFSRWDHVTRGWLEEPGSYEIRVGSSSRDIRLKGVVDR